MKNRSLGDLTKDKYIDQVIRVNHAGEYGAKRIYEGQLAVLGKTKIGPLIRHMAKQEDEHLKYFEEEIVKRRVRPTLLFPFWHIAGYMLGAGGALLGEKTAMACTEAVEEVIDEHYQNQLETLEDSESDLKANIAKFREEELEHKQMAEDNKSKQAPAHRILTGLIKGGCRTAIWLAKKI